MRAATRRQPQRLGRGRHPRRRRRSQLPAWDDATLAEQRHRS